MYSLGATIPVLGGRVEKMMSVVITDDIHGHY
jgi:hypothetical protein